MPAPDRTLGRTHVWRPATFSPDVGERPGGGRPADAVGIHGLRHYYATVLVHAGASVKTVQLALGHSTPTVTLNTYVHEWPDVLDRSRLLIAARSGNTKRRPRRL